jgi:hypothetical protein
MIVKIQQSLFDSTGATSVMIYDETREFMYQSYKPEEVVPIVELLGERPKAYFKAEVVDTKFNILEEVEAPDW